jgi:hypothetical protein
MNARSPAHTCLGAALAIAGVAAILTAVTARAAKPAATQVIADDEAGIVLVMVQGTEVARFDARGLHVAGDLSYSGQITDTGTQQGGHSPSSAKAAEDKP